jgi:quercetin dioxygenase-like cupin family protein
VVLVGKHQYTIDGKTYDAAPGSYLVIPAKVHHHLKCGAESDCVVLYQWAGPLDFHFDK